MIPPLAVAFLSGFAIETACVYWVHFSERNRSLPTALCAIAVGVSQHSGIGEAPGWVAGICFGLGCGVGTFIAVERKRRAATRAALRAACSSGAPEAAAPPPARAADLPPPVMPTTTPEGCTR